MLRFGFAASLLALFAVTGCEEKKDTKTTTTTAAAQPAQTGSPAQTAPAIAPLPTAEKKADEKTIEPVATWKGFSTPESVLYDDAADCYLTSNINGKPADVDGNGYVSKLAPDGKVTEPKWIEGGKNKVTLNAPKGMAFSGDSLYVADIDTVRIFDRKTGAPTGEVKIPGALFLNDVAVTSDGRVLVTDTGVDKDFAPKGTDAVWAIDKTKKASALAKSKDLKNPNGIVAIGEKIWVVNGAGELFELDPKTGKKGDPKTLPKGQLDGIVAAGDEIFVSSWDAKTVYRAKGDSAFAPFVENVEAPADIGYDTKRHRLLLPLFKGNEVRAYDVVK